MTQVDPPELSTITKELEREGYGMISHTKGKWYRSTSAYLPVLWPCVRIP